MIDQQPHLRPPTAAYVHIPFCVSKCHYCEFNSYPGMDSLFAEYTQALIAEVEDTAPLAGARPLETVYLGGGTPTLLPADYLTDILSAIRATLDLAESAEITVEANPGTIDESKLVQLRTGGFNRLSVGVQSFDDDFLTKIGRVHTASEAVEAFQAARRAGFDNIGIDLIFALPGQSLDHWRRTLDTAVSLGSEHISLYELTIEEGTRFAEMCAQGKLDLPDEDLQIEMYELVISRLASAGYEHYEVSNFARPDFRSRHNQVYWHNLPYYGFGAGATSYVGGVRARRVASPRDYITSVCSESGPVEFSERLTGRELLAETIIQGLRMLDGINISELDLQYQTDVVQEFRQEIDNLRRRGLLDLSNSRFKVTHKGLLLLNDVSAEFV